MTTNASGTERNSYGDRGDPIAQGMSQASANYREEYEPVINVGQTERLLTGAGAIGLAAYGYKRGDLLGVAVAALGGVLFHRAISGHCALYARMGYSTAEKGEAFDYGRGETSAEPHEYFKRGIHVEESITIARPRAEMYRFWRRFENLPSFMDHLEAVTATGPTYSHWVAKAPAGMRVEWDAEIINEEEDHLTRDRSASSTPPPARRR
jgi:uncharacterized membrane protein